MNPLRYLGEWSPGLIGVFALCIAILLAHGWFRLRERRGDWGPSLARIAPAAGYAPADLRADAASTPVRDGTDRLLLGLAAPFVEAAGLLHDRWSLVPAFCGEDWRRRLAAVAEQRGVVRARDWKASAAALEQALHGLDAGDLDDAERALLRPWLVANYAMLLRLGVAARHTTGRRARERLARAALPLRTHHADWLSFGDAFIAAAERIQPGGTTDLRADLRRLYAPDGPWAETAWPT